MSNFFFSTMFSMQSENCIPFVNIFDIISLFAAELEDPKIDISGKGLPVMYENDKFNNLLVTVK